jgi:hypothetical protein
MAAEPEVTTETGQTDTSQAADTTAAEPQKHQHSPRLLNVCRELGIDPAQAATMDDAALRREIQDAQLEFQVRTARNPPRPQQQPKPQPQAEPEETFEIPAELQARLTDVDPAVIELAKHIGNQNIARTKKAQQEVQQLRQQQNIRELHQAVDRVLDTLPAVKGTKQARHRSVWAEMDQLAADGVIDHTTPVADAVKLAYANVYGSDEGEPAPKPTTTAAQSKRATPTAKPTNRLEPQLQGKLDHLNGNTAEDFIP